MKTDRQFTHSNFGNQIRIELRGREVHLVLVADTPAQASAAAEDLVEQLMTGAVSLTLMGHPTDVEESDGYH